MSLTRYNRAMRKAITTAVAALAAALTFAPLASASPGLNEDQYNFLKSLEEVGIEVPNAGQALDTADNICWLSREGFTTPEIADGYLDGYLNPVQQGLAKYVVVQARIHLCPDTVLPVPVEARVT